MKVPLPMQAAGAPTQPVQQTRVPSIPAPTQVPMQTRTQVQMQVPVQIPVPEIPPVPQSGPRDAESDEERPARKISELLKSCSTLTELDLKGFYLFIHMFSWCD